LHKRLFYSLTLSEMIRSITMARGYFKFQQLIIRVLKS
jgi:hypothetical protein